MLNVKRIRENEKPVNMVDGVDLVDDVDTGKVRLRSCVYSVHKGHSFRCLDKSNWLGLPFLRVIGTLRKSCVK